jgi:hypothetical protein
MRKPGLEPGRVTPLDPKSCSHPSIAFFSCVQSGTEWQGSARESLACTTATTTSILFAARVFSKLPRSPQPQDIGHDSLQFRRREQALKCCSSHGISINLFGGRFMGTIHSSRWSSHSRRWTTGEAMVLKARTVAAVAQLPRVPGAWQLEYSATLAWGPLRDLLTLETVPQPFGGVQWLLRCSGCGTLRRALYAPRRARALRCRECAGLAYHCQRLAPFDRATARARKLARALGAPEPMDVILSGVMPEKPRYLQRRTYESRIAQLRAAIARREEIFFVDSCRYLDRVSPNWRRS